jgi:metacaspase-1
MNTQSPALVYVHGISKHNAGYSDEWFAALRPHLAVPVEKVEVLWSDIVNAKAMAAGEDKAMIEANVARRQIEAELEARKQVNRQAEHEAEALPEDAKALCGAVSFSLDDFVRYMVCSATRESILSQFNDVVFPLLRDGRSIHVVAHSWGTVVSYEGLRRLDAQQFPGRVANLIVLGSALSIEAVQHNLFGRVRDGCCPRLVARFVNVDAGGDIVGGQIAPQFQVTKEFLDQYPTGCSTFFRRHTAINPLCAHGSYFRPENTAVNRDIVAHFINQANA